MLDQVDLDLKLPKEIYRNIMRLQQDRLFELAELVYERKTPVMIVFEGWDAAGKGTTIRKLTEKLDPRGFKVLPTRAAQAHEQDKPWLWRFWMNIPRHGQIAIYDRSWYGRVLVERVEHLTAIPDWIRAYEEINAFERTLAADGAVFVKFFLHISKREQLRRFISLTQQTANAWQVTADDWDYHRRYDEYVVAVNDMLANTSTPIAPWDVVPATDRLYCRFHCFRTIIERMESALGVEPVKELTLDLSELDAEMLHRAKREASKKQQESKEEGKKGKKKEGKKQKTNNQHDDQELSDKTGNGKNVTIEAEKEQKKALKKKAQKASKAQLQIEARLEDIHDIEENGANNGGAVLALAVNGETDDDQEETDA